MKVEMWKNKSWACFSLVAFWLSAATSFKIQSALLSLTYSIGCLNFWKRFSGECVGAFCCTTSASQIILACSTCVHPQRGAKCNSRWFRADWRQQFSSISSVEWPFATALLSPSFPVSTGIYTTQDLVSLPIPSLPRDWLHAQFFPLLYY